VKFINDLIEWWANHDDSFFQILIGLLIALVGPLVTFYVGRSTDLHCMHTGAQTIRCAITHQLLGIQPMDTRQVDGIQKAEVDENLESGSDSTYRVIFITAYGNEPLTSSYSSGYSSKAELVKQIDTYIDSDQQSPLDVQMKIEWWVWVLLFGSIGLGVGMILGSLKKFVA
jgi:hypothetical protein